MKDENKTTVKLSSPVTFDYQLIHKITFDLIHINEGWDDVKHDYAYKNRSTYTASDIVEFFEQFLYYQVEWLLNSNKFAEMVRGVPHYRYHWQTTDDNGKKIRIYIDLPQKYTGEGIVVTVFHPEDKK